jgi:hypothetical protein
MARPRPVVSTPFHTTQRGTMRIGSFGAAKPPQNYQFLFSPPLGAGPGVGEVPKTLFND